MALRMRASLERGKASTVSRHQSRAGQLYFPNLFCWSRNLTLTVGRYAADLLGCRS